MDYDNFRHTIFALMDAYSNQHEFVKKRLPIPVIESANEQVAKIRGQALAMVRNEELGIPSLSSLQILFSQVIQVLDEDEHNVEALDQLSLVSTVMDIAYPGKGLDFDLIDSDS